MIKAIIFDCFGVLTTDAWLPFKERHFGHNQELFDEATSLGQQANAGFISHTDFATGIARLAGISVSEVEAKIQKNIANEQLFDYIAGLKGNYRIGMLSNASENWLGHLFSEGQIALLDEVALSYETGFTKPRPQAFEAIADKLGVEIEACVMVDDQERHYTGAREAGMQAILYQDFDLFKQQLEVLLNQSE
ncbi:MAG: putative (S)-2-haloacid dehalogenase [Candidatus Saccharibacteria bacterium]|nr:putative (S)-2-haloacid dehalogenase [Candidatus Saccharibacteria bacterium]